MTDKIITDEQISQAFSNTNNFVTTDHRRILLEAVKRTAVGCHNGSAISDTALKLGLTKESSEIGNGEAPRLTQKGLDFIVQESAATFEQEDLHEAQSINRPSI